MTLTGTQMQSLAAALHAAYPDVERLDLDSAGLRGLLAALPTLPVPANDISRGEIAVLKWLWMRHADTGPGPDHGGGD